MSINPRRIYVVTKTLACFSVRFLLLFVFTTAFFFQQSLGQCSGLFNNTGYTLTSLVDADGLASKSILDRGTSTHQTVPLLQIEIQEDENLPEQSLSSNSSTPQGFEDLSRGLELKVLIGLIRQAIVVQDIKPSPLFLLHQSWQGFLI